MPMTRLVAVMKIWCRLPLALLLGGLLFCATGAAEAGGPINTGYFGNTAILGYDPVAYFADGRAVQGVPAFSYKWLGATWQFASAEHRDAFIADPIRYAPQYGGLCAGAMAFNQITSNVDPEAWRIIEGKLYLFGGKAGLEEDYDPYAADMIKKADANWPAIRDRLAAN
jgi:YHS domain-containing protein